MEDAVILKKQLKAWEKEFEAKHGRKPSKTDIKENNMGRKK
jgi:hypothetical protein